MFTDTQQSRASFTFAIDPKVPVSGPLGTITNVTCAVGLSIDAAPVVTASTGSGSAQLSAGGLMGYSGIGALSAPAGPSGMAPSPAQMIGPQPLGSSQAKVTINYTAPTVLLCAINISATPFTAAVILPASGNISLPLDTQAVEIVMTNWSLAPVSRFPPIMLPQYQLSGTLAITANGSTQTVNVG